MFTITFQNTQLFMNGLFLFDHNYVVLAFCNARLVSIQRIDTNLYAPSTYLL